MTNTPLRLHHRVALFVLAVTAPLLACSRPSHDDLRKLSEPTPGIGYGTAMADVARRFEVLGRAAAAGRFELSEYQLGEITEQFEQTLPAAAPPREGRPEVLPPMASAFVQTNLPDLRRALAARDRTQAAAAFARAANACNGCHQESGHGFIEVPSSAGRGIPNTDPLAP